MGLSGCSSAVHIHPITGNDMYIRDNKDVCFSEDYFEHVVATLVGEK